MPTQPQPVTLAQVVHKAVEACGEGDGLDALLARFEDADVPVAGLGDVQEMIDEAIGAIAADDPEPELQMAGAVVVYLAHRRDELDEEPEELPRLAARAEFKGQPSAEVTEWLAQQGVAVR